MVLIHNGIFNVIPIKLPMVFESVLMKWMKLESIIREVSQKEKHQYSILTHIYGI